MVSWARRGRTVLARSVCAALVLALVIGRGAAIAGEPWKDALRKELASIYTLTREATLSDRITKQGTVLVVMKDGITADLASDVRNSVTRVTDGAVAEQGGAVAAIFTKKRSRVFRKGEHVYVTDIDAYDDGLMLKVLSCDTTDINENGTTRPTRYKGAIKFVHAKGDGPALSASQLKQVIDVILMPEAEATAVNTKTIALGQTRPDVEAILGKPERIVDLGSKVTYVYRDMKVVFVDGKVADVQ